MEEGDDILQAPAREDHALKLCEGSVAVLLALTGQRGTEEIRREEHLTKGQGQRVDGYGWIAS